MDEREDQDRLLRELIDAARPDSEDLADPEFAPLVERARRDVQVRRILQRSQRLDRALGDALHDLAVPAGSVDRLLATLAAATERPAEQVAAETTPAEIVPPLHSSQPQRSLAHVSQRWAGPGAIAATIAVLAIMMAYFLWRPVAGELDPEGILLTDWLRTVDEAAADQNPIGQKLPPKKFPPAASLAVKPTAWREIKGLLDRPGGVAYQLRAPGARATLYVIEFDAGRNAPRLVNLPTSPPPKSAKTTQGHAMSVWRSGDLVYLLVVEGGEAQYKAFVAPAGQLARVDGNRGGNCWAFLPPTGCAAWAAQSS